MARRVSRPARDRRIVDPNQPRFVQLGFVVDPAKSGSEVTVFFAVTTLPTEGELKDWDFILRDIPKIWREDGLAYPISAAKGAAPNELILTYGGGVILAGEAFIISPFDPNLRSADGGFAAPARFVVP